jgi:hypothetical protein
MGVFVSLLILVLWPLIITRIVFSIIDSLSAICSCSTPFVFLVPALIVNNLNVVIIAIATVNFKSAHEGNGVYGNFN